MFLKFLAFGIGWFVVASFFGVVVAITTVLVVGSIVWMAVEPILGAAKLIIFGS